MWVVEHCLVVMMRSAKVTFEASVVPEYRTRVSYVYVGHLMGGATLGYRLLQRVWQSVGIKR